MNFYDRISDYNRDEVRPSSKTVYDLFKKHRKNDREIFFLWLSVVACFIGLAVFLTVVWWVIGNYTMIETADGMILFVENAR